MQYSRALKNVKVLYSTVAQKMLMYKTLDHYTITVNKKKYKF
jgi:hypothetical protein